MAREYRPVADRQKSLEPVPPVANFTLAGVRMMYEGSGGEKFRRTTSGHCRIQIFEFPGIDFHLGGDEPHHTIYSSSSALGSVASSLVDYFQKSTFSRHYSVSPRLRYNVNETGETIKSQQRGRVPVFLVIEESNQLAPVDMDGCECRIWEDVVVRDGKRDGTGSRAGLGVINVWVLLRIVAAHTALSARCYRPYSSLLQPEPNSLSAARLDVPL